ncbi:MAG TPA: ABC transporter permease [Chitinophagaceae bacterium]
MHHSNGKTYSQTTALWAVSKASLRALKRSPSAIIFSLVFPFIFILVFGFIGGGGPTIRVAFTKTTDTSNAFYQVLKQIKNIRIVEKDSISLEEDLQKGRITAILNIEKNNDTTLPRYRMQSRTSTAAADKIQILNSIITSITQTIDRQAFPNAPSLTKVEAPVVVPGRVYRTIDFILPGQLGFSLLSSAVFGIAFMFFNLRQTLVLKRFYATPINRLNIVLGEVLARTIFQLVVTAFILVVGALFFNYTLIHGFITFLEIMLLSFVALIIFMGFGFIVSGRAKSDSSIPPFANLITLPQFLLGGTFFSVDAFPPWLQPISKVMPLTHLNTAMRDIAFEGAHLWDVWEELGVLAIWGIVVYAVAVKTFRWE